MSLDVYLTTKETFVEPQGIPVRENGETKLITRDEWDTRYPNRIPLAIDSHFTNEAYHANITHNLNTMAKAAGIYECLWRPEEIGITQAEQLIEPLRAGLELLESDPARFEKFNPENGWGSYEGLMQFVRNYLKACEQFPGAEVSVWR